MQGLAHQRPRDLIGLNSFVQPFRRLFIAVTVADKGPILVAGGQVAILFQLRFVAHSIGASTHRLPTRAHFDKHRDSPRIVLDARLTPVTHEDEGRPIKWTRKFGALQQLDLGALQGRGL